MTFFFVRIMKKVEKKGIKKLAYRGDREIDRGRDRARERLGEREIRRERDRER